MSAGKNGEACGVLAVVETIYGTDPTPSTSTDGVRVIKPRPAPTIGYLYDGVRGLQNAGFANIALAPKKGRFAEFTIAMEVKGYGSDYTSSAIVPPDGIHQLLQCAGHTATYSSGPDLWTYVPTAATATPKSCTVWLYTRTQLYKVTGVYANLEIKADNVGIPVWEFSCKGIMATDPADSALASITYHDQSVIPPAASGVTFEWGDLTAPVLRNFNFNAGRKFDSPRANQVATDGHGGFTPGARNPMIDLTMEATTLATGDFSDTSTIDPFNLIQNATLGQDLSYTVGGTQYNRWKLVCTSTQAHTLEEIDEDPAALWKIGIRPYTTQTSASDYSIILF